MKQYENMKQNMKGQIIANFVHKFAVKGGEIL